MNIPSEITLQILRYVDPYECKSIIKKLLPWKNKASITYLLGLLNYRLYSKKLVVMENMVSTYDRNSTVLSLPSFINNIHTDSFENHLFKQSTPHHLSFLFWRRVDEYTEFSRALNTFSAILDNEKNEVHQFIKRVQTISYHVHGRLFMVENPSSISVMTIKSLVSLSGSNFRDKLVSIRIDSTEIGEFFGMQWARLFKKFVNLKVLEINSSLVVLDDDQLTFHFEAPPKLQVLLMDNNHMHCVSEELLRKLPKSIESLLFRNCCLFEFASEERSLYEILPNLTSLDLSSNELYFLNSKLFEHYVDFELNIKDVDLEQGCFRNLKKLAIKGGFTLVI